MQKHACTCTNVIQFQSSLSTFRQEDHKSPQHSQVSMKIHSDSCQCMVCWTKARVERSPRGVLPCQWQNGYSQFLYVYLFDLHVCLFSRIFHSHCSNQHYSQGKTVLEENGHMRTMDATYRRQISHPTQTPSEKVTTPSFLSLRCDITKV